MLAGTTTWADTFEYYRYGKLSPMPQADWTRLFVTLKSKPTADKAARIQKLVPTALRGSQAPALYTPSGGFVVSISPNAGLTSANYRKVLDELVNDPDVVSVLPAFVTSKFGPADPVFVSGKIIVHTDAANQKLWQDRIAELGLKVAEIQPLGKTVALVAQPGAGADVFALARRLYTLGGCSIAEPNMVFTGHNDYTPNDPSYGTQWFLEQASNKDIDASGAWDQLIATSAGQVRVAVIDGNGFQLTHPDLAGNYVRAYSAVNNDSNPTPTNAYDNHGTPCAGLVAGVTNNSLGVASVGALWVKVAPCVIGYNATSTGTFSTDATIIGRATSWLVGVSNVVASSHSYGYGAGSLATAVDANFTTMRNSPRGGKGAVVCASTGNSGLLNTTAYPASYSSTLGVGASDANDLKASFSNYGTLCDIAAPGVSTYTLDRTGADGYTTTAGTAGDYTSFNGTSAACPVAAGVVGLIGAIAPTATVSDYENYIQQSVDKAGGYSYTTVSGRTQGTWSQEFGYGRVNARKALLLAAGTPIVPIYTDALGTLSCGQVVAGTTVGAVNDITTYPGYAFNESGPDKTYSFTLSTKSAVTLTLSGASVNLDLFLFNGTTTSSLLAYGDNSITSTLDAGTYYVSVDGLNGVSGTFNLGLNCVCVPTADCSQKDYFSRITLNTVSNDTATACTGSSYSSLNAPTFSVTSGQTVSFRLSHDPAYGEYDQIYIDLNGDGDFADAGEQVYSSADRVIVRSGSFTMPTASVTNTRIRFRCSYSAQATDACAAVTYGQTLDYPITINAAVPVYTLVLGSTPVCPGGLVTPTSLTLSPVNAIADTATLQVLRTSDNSVVAQITRTSNSFTAPAAWAGTSVQVYVKARFVASTGVNATLNVAAALATPTASLVQPNCTTSTGSITIDPQTGCEYTLNGSTYQPSNVFTGVASGSYNLYVRQTASGCTAMSTSPVTVNPAPAVPSIPTGQATQPLCGQLTGSITIAAQSGVEHSLDGSTYQAGNLFNGVGAGSYTLYVRSLNGGCVAISTTGVTITVPTVPAAVTVNYSGTYCNSATIIAVGGNGGTIYFQGTTSGGTSTATPSASQTVTSTGLYYFRAQSADGCWGPEGSADIGIYPMPGVPTYSVAQPTCGQSTGTITVDLQSGAFYSLDGITYQSNNIFSNLTAGTYTVYVNTGSAACSTSASGILINAAPVVPGAVSVTGGGVVCGSTVLNASGGSGGTIYFQGSTSGGTSTATPSVQQTISTSGAFYFRAQSADGCWSSEGVANITIVPVLTVSSFSPSSGSVGTVVTLSGSGFFGASAVKFGTLSAAFTVVNDNQITATVPAAAPVGSSVITITKATCGDVSYTTAFSVISTDLAWRWVRQGVTSGAGQTAQYNRVRTDVNGNFYAAGYISGGATTIQGGANASVVLTPVGGRDGILARYNRQGNLSWITSFYSTGDDEVLGLATDRFGYAYVSGYFNGTMTIHANSGRDTSLTSVGGSDMFVAKIHPNGFIVWAFRMGASGNDRAEGVDVAPDLRFYVAGSFIGNTAIGGIFGTVIPFTSRGNYDAFLAKFSDLGSLYWAIQGGGTGNDFGYGAAADISGGGYLMGSFEGTATFNSSLGGTTPISKTVVGGSDGFVLGVSVTGQLNWVASMGGTTNENVRDVAPDPRGTGLVAVGGFSQTATFGSLGNLTSTGFYDAFAVRLSNTGAFEWVNKAGSFGQDQAWGVRLDRSGNPIVAMSFAQTSPIFGASSSSVSQGALDGLLVKLNAGTGVAQWVAQVSGTGGDDFAYGVDTTSLGGAIGSGAISTSASFGTLGPYTVAGTRNAWLARYSASTGAFREAAQFDGMNFANGLSIYPNPAQQAFHVGFDGERAQMQVYGTDGRLMLSRSVAPGERILQDFPKGAYFVRLFTDKGQNLHGRLVVE